MRVQSYRLAGDPVRVMFPTREEELASFFDWLDRTPVVAVDTETTGLDIFSRGFQVRLVQFGDAHEAWVLRVDRFVSFIREAFRRIVAAGRHVVLHNATFDLLALDRLGVLDLAEVYERAFDTRILAHLLDPRARSEGGMGHGLKELCSVFVDASAPDTQEGLKDVFRTEYGATKETGWRVIDTDHPVYVLYAGLDVLLTSRLFNVLGPEVQRRGLTRLASFELALAGLLARMERRGFLLDVEYTESLTETLKRQRIEGEDEARLYGVKNVEAPRQVAAALEGMGAVLVERTATGQPKVDKAVLAALADNGNLLAAAVLKAKRANKFRETYVDAMLALRDEADRIHPKINGLQARTARMSISRPPLQQLPSGDWTIRRCLLADPGHLIIAADYAQVELRVLAALADERRMKEAIAAGIDLHDVTATALFGEGFTKAQRKLAKNVGFGKVYGGGATTLARQAGVDIDTAKRAADAYDRNFPAIKRLAKRLISRAEFGEREVITPTGRRLPLDRDRLYAATNYLVQSTARDVLAQALLDLDDAGLGDYLLLPIHDEALGQAPEAEAAEVAQAFKDVMTMDFQGVRLDADAEVYGASWGHGYGAAA